MRAGTGHDRAGAAAGLPAVHSMGRVRTERADTAARLHAPRLVGVLTPALAACACAAAAPAAACRAAPLLLQWHAQQLVLHGAAARAPSDPTISGSTGMPVGRFGHSFHRQRGHANPRLNAAAAAAAAAAGDSGGSVPAGLLSQATG